MAQADNNNLQWWQPGFGLQQIERAISNVPRPTRSPFNPEIGAPPPTAPRIDQSHAATERSMTPGAPNPPSGRYVSLGNGNVLDTQTGDTYNANGQIISGPDYKGNTGNNLGYTGGSGGGMTAYESAQVALDKQKLADAEAQQKADQAYRQAQALDTFNKNWQDYQTKNYYGSFYGPAAAAPAGSPFAYKLPEPDFVQQYYANNPNAGPDPFQQALPFSGYSGSGFLNPQQPGIQNAGAIPAGANVSAPISGAAPANPFPGATTGSLGAYNPGAPQTGQNVPLDPNLLNAISSHPAANQFVLSLPGAMDFVSKALGSGATGAPTGTPQPNVAAPTSGGSNG